MAQTTRRPAHLMGWLRSVGASVTHGEVVIWPAVLAAVPVGVAAYLVGSNGGDVRVDGALASMAALLRRPAGVHDRAHA